jgi:hypothetical protein
MARQVDSDGGLEQNLPTKPEQAEQHWPIANARPSGK